VGSPILKEFTSRNIIYLALNYGGDQFKVVSVITDFHVVQNGKFSKTYQT